jgi:peptide/nickel transport system permease protein
MLLGADVQGRDVFSRLLQGSRISLTIGLLGVAISVILGSILGTISGYSVGTVDNLIQRLIEVIASVPQIPLWAALAAILPREMSIIQRYFYITLVLSLISWTGLARQVRGKVLAYRTLDYTLAARAAGASHIRIILGHMLPNAISHIIVVAAFGVPAAMLGETALSFLGLGMLPPAVSWGVLLRDAQQIQTVIQHRWLLTPSIAVILAVTCYQFLADGLRDAADPYA